MPTPRKAPRFGKSPAHHRLIMSNLATELFRHGRIRTTKAKAKTVQPLAEKMVTFAKRGDVHARRQVLKTVRDKDVVHKLFADIGPAFAERDGGYTRVLKLGPRKGDAAEMALIELVEGLEVGEETGLAEAPRRRWSLRRRRGGTLSSAAREREEETAAAYDRGDEDLLDEDLAEEDLAEEDPVDEDPVDGDVADEIEGEGLETTDQGGDVDVSAVAAGDQTADDLAAGPYTVADEAPQPGEPAARPEGDETAGDEPAEDVPDEGPTGVAVEPPEPDEGERP